MRAPSFEKGEKGASVYGGALTEEQINRYLEVLERMCQWAMDNNYDEIQWA
jgi:hypothetical protein